MCLSEKWGGVLLIVLLTALGGCKAPKEVNLTGVTGKDPTKGAIHGVERKHAWIVANVPGQSVTFDVSLKNRLNSAANTSLDIDSVHLQGTDHYFSMAGYGENALNKFQKSSLTLNYPPIALPALNDVTKTRVIPYVVQASYGAEVKTSDPGYVEVLRPYCEVDTEPFSTLGMTFETPSGIAPAGGWPTILFVHGGGLVSRNHVDMAAYAHYMLGQGYAVANMNHRLVATSNHETSSGIYSLAHSWKEPVADVKCAIRYLKQNSYVLGVNPYKIGLVGHSSGANIALEAAVTVDSSIPEFAEQGEAIRLAGATGHFDTSVAALFTMDAIVNFQVFWKIFGESADALIKANGNLVSESTVYNSAFVNGQRKVNGFAPTAYSDVSWHDHPNAVLQDVTQYIGAETDLPIFMAHSSVNFVQKLPLWILTVDLVEVPFHAWESGCTFYNKIVAAGSTKQHEQTFIRSLSNTNHNDFVKDRDTVQAMSLDMTSFFNFYLRQQGNKPATDFDYDRCADLE